MPQPASRPYTGRFAPSPTGPLHFGSLITAVASYLDARAQGGRWLLRIEDLDRPRTRAGASDGILRTLAAHGLHWDEAPLWQSERERHYAEALEHLAQLGVIFYCRCSRRELRGHTVYPGYCRTRRDPPRSSRGQEFAVRVEVPQRRIGFTDLLQGPFSQELAVQVGDFIIRRRDGLFAYQLAVVVDDASSGVTRILRGADLLDNTPRQILLAELLGHRHPQYAHLPVIMDRHNSKLSKQTQAMAVEQHRAADNLVSVLELLQQRPPPDLRRESTEAVLAWAIEHWNLARVPASAAFTSFVGI